MQQPLVSLTGSAIVLLLLVLAGKALPKDRDTANVIKVLLPHRCSVREQMNRGDRREMFVRYHADHSSFVNVDLMPVENDLRRSVAATMATRREQVIFFSADETLSFGEALRVIDDLKKDDPELWVMLVTRSQRTELDHAPLNQPTMLCLTAATL